MRTLPLRIVRESYALVRPFWRWKLAVVALAAVFSSALQMAGLASVFPFLALASNPEGSGSIWPFGLSTSARFIYSITASGSPSSEHHGLIATL